MLEVLLIRPGSTIFDEEGRIKGALDIPLSAAGREQAQALSLSLQTIKLDCLYVAPCESALSSAAAIAERNFCKQKTLDCLRNLDHGLWQGKLVADVRRLQPRVYRQFQEHPTDVCPPAGETIQEGLERVRASVDKLIRKHQGGRIGLIVPQPMASIVRFTLVAGSFGDLWKSELDFGQYETIQVSRSAAARSFELETV
jgi:phosphoserine phosphatase